MLANHNLIDQRDNFFVLVIKTQESFEKGLNRTSDLLNVSNPNNLLYCICYKTWDFVYFPNGKVGFTTKKVKKL